MIHTYHLTKRLAKLNIGGTRVSYEHIYDCLKFHLCNDSLVEAVRNTTRKRFKSLPRKIRLVVHTYPAIDPPKGWLVIEPMGLPGLLYVKPARRQRYMVAINGNAHSELTRINPTGQPVYVKVISDEEKKTKRRQGGQVSSRKHRQVSSQLRRNRLGKKPQAEAQADASTAHQPADRCTA
jgi:hypothetical protein